MPQTSMRPFAGNTDWLGIFSNAYSRLGDVGAAEARGIEGRAAGIARGIHALGAGVGRHRAESRARAERNQARLDARQDSRRREARMQRSEDRQNLAYAERRRSTAHAQAQMLRDALRHKPELAQDQTFQARMKELDAETGRWTNTTQLLEARIFKSGQDPMSIVPEPT